ncbi:MAG: hypothetical protein V4805_16545 [Pseudomonadota bacterium]
MKRDIKSGTLLAAAAAAMALSGSVNAAATTPVYANDNVKCVGINSCRGKGACATATNACKGHNSCSGKGYVRTTAAACLDLGGGMLLDTAKD